MKLGHRKTPTALAGIINNVALKRKTAKKKSTDDFVLFPETTFEGK